MLRAKWSSALRRYRHGGAREILLLYPNRLLRWIKSFGKFWGLMVELKGDAVRIEGLHFSVAVPGISTAEKSRFLFDRYERPERLTIREFLDRDLPVVELGANIGIVSCVVNARLTRPDRHIVVEANPTLIPLLEKNKARNRCEFEIVACALAYGVDEVSFNLDEDVLGSSLMVETSKTVVVPTITLKDIIEQHKFMPCTLICDIEGSEIELIRNETDLIRNCVQTFFVEVHPDITGREELDSALRTLTEIGFDIKFDRWSNMVLCNRAFAGDRFESTGALVAQ